VNGRTTLTPLEAAKSVTDSEKLLNALSALIEVRRVKRSDPVAKKGIVAVVAASLALFGLIRLYRYLYPKKAPKPECSDMSEPEPEVE